MTIRLGLVAASRIARKAIIDPLSDVDGVELTAVAARDLERARAAADEWGAPHAFGSYEELLRSDAVDAVYIGTPASLHRHWAIAAIEAGKHVLCEKPLAANADDARAIADAARDGDVVVMEAFHWRYHPFVERIRATLDEGVLGRIDRIEAAFDIPDGWIPRDDIRWELGLGGGATMDLGCYAIQFVRWAARSEPDVVAAEAVCPVEEIDGSLTAELRWPSGVTGRIQSSMIATGSQVEVWLRVIGEHGRLIATNPLAPQHGATLVVESGDRIWYEQAETSTSYFHQLVAFRDAIVEGREFPTTVDDGVRNMQVIDACYRAAGLSPRPAD
ncbi:MAG: oxidoreductase [Acidimicrobiaceae bacterium]|nr:oxidoreductase [Acidimicrobiaceae bacterium]